MVSQNCFPEQMVITAAGPAAPGCCRRWVKIAVGRGVPIVCASFLGYDEQAHRRNPGSMFAHWSLKGIDDTIRDICRAAGQSSCPKYETIIYSDHGQETVTWYGSRYGVPVKEAIRNAFYDLNPDEKHVHPASYDNILDGLYKKARALIMNQPFSENLQKDSGPVSRDKIEITTMGPLGHVYLPGSPAGEFIRDLRHLIQDYRNGYVSHEHPENSQL